MQKFIHMDILDNFEYLDQVYDLLPSLLQKFDKGKGDQFLLKMIPSFRATPFDLKKLEELLVYGRTEGGLVKTYSAHFENLI